MNNFLLAALVSICMASCGTTGNNDSHENKDPQSNSKVSFELGPTEKLNELTSIPIRKLYLLADGKKWEIGPLEGLADILPEANWAENGIPAHALAVVHNYHGADFYYYAVREQDRVMVYEGGPYIDEIDGELKFIYENRIDPLMIGRWEAKDSPENWVFYNGLYYYGDGFEEGISYRISKDTLFTGLGDAQIIEKLTEQEFVVRDVENTYRNFWIKAELE